mgnify:CR=1 FL=1|tara:strand:+ start:39621 stop:40187 length:567 start_codon:yes stop_codon:yes gene_type:complete
MSEETKRPLKRSLPLPPPDKGAHPNGHRHGEAFMLMIYRSEDGRDVETIWNSRDGVCPFMVGARAAEPGKVGSLMQHVHWGADCYAPYHVPNVGDRIFIDLTLEIAKPMVEQQIDLWWDDADNPMHETFETKDEAHDALIAECMKDGAPATVLVTHELQMMFYNRIAAHERKLMERARGERYPKGPRG